MSETWYTGNDVKLKSLYSYLNSMVGDDFTVGDGKDKIFVYLGPEGQKRISSVPKSWLGLTVEVAKCKSFEAK